MPGLLQVAIKEGTGCGKKQKSPKFLGKLTPRSLNLFEASRQQGTDAGKHWNKEGKEEERTPQWIKKQESS